MTPLFSSPAPQWTDTSAVAPAAYRLSPILDGTGFWTLLEGETPSGAYVVDSGSGFTVIDDTLTVGLKPTLTPSGMVTIY